MKKKLSIEDFEDKTTSNGKKYVRFKTSDGWMSCFNKDAYEVLKKLCGEEVVVDVVKSGNFENIKKAYPEITEDEDEEKGEEIGEVKKPRDKSMATKKEMYVSYAKDAFCAIVTRISQAKFDDMSEEQILRLMDTSVKAIQKAQAQF